MNLLSLSIRPVVPWKSAAGTPSAKSPRRARSEPAAWPPIPDPLPPRPARYSPPSSPGGAAPPARADASATGAAEWHDAAPVADHAMLPSPLQRGLGLRVLLCRGHLWVHLRYGPVTRSPPQGRLCQLASSVSFPPRLQPKLR